MNLAVRPPPSWPLPESLAFMQKLWQLNHGLELLSSAMAKRLGVTVQQRMIIRCVGKYPGITAGQLAELLHLDRGTVSTALARLEKKQLLKRRRDPRDKRRVSLGLTPEGRVLDRSTEGTLESAVDRLLRESDAARIAATVDVLVRLTAIVDEEVRRAP